VGKIVRLKPHGAFRREGDRHHPQSGAGQVPPSWPAPPSFAGFVELEPLERPTFVDDYPPGVLAKEQELRAKVITASERIHADPFWKDHTGTDRLAAEMALKKAAKKQLGAAADRA